MGDNKRALDFYERANAIQPRAETFSNMGTIYYGLGDYAKAAAAYEGSLLIRPLERDHATATSVMPTRTWDGATMRGAPIGRR